MGRCRQSKVTGVRSPQNEMGNNASDAIATYHDGDCALNLSARLLSGSSWINSRARRSNLTYFYSGSSPAPGGSDNLTDVIFYYHVLAFVPLNAVRAGLTRGVQAGFGISTFLGRAFSLHRLPPSQRRLRFTNFGIFNCVTSGTAR